MKTMDAQTLISVLDFSRARLNASIETIEKSGQDVKKVLAWRPGPGRAHIGWQLMHCAATHDRYLHVAMLGGAAPKDEAIVAAFGGGSTPSDQNVPSLESIKAKLESNYAAFRAYVAGVNSQELTTKMVGAPGKQRTLGEAIILMAWHEAHHQGQVHLTWNLYKAAHGIA
jgi:uncharacterized damage-inducible protein DinB